MFPRSSVTITRSPDPELGTARSSLQEDLAGTLKFMCSSGWPERQGYTALALTNVTCEYRNPGTHNSRHSWARSSSNLWTIPLRVRIQCAVGWTSEGVRTKYLHVYEPATMLGMRTANPHGSKCQISGPDGTTSTCQAEANRTN